MSPASPAGARLYLVPQAGASFATSAKYQAIARCC